jgi:hypothetical protein
MCGVGQSPDRPVRRPTSSGRVQRLPANTPLSTVFRLTCSAYRDRRFFAITLSPRPGRVRAMSTCGLGRSTRLDGSREYSHFGSARTSDRAAGPGTRRTRRHRAARARRAVIKRSRQLESRLTDDGTQPLTRSRRARARLASGSTQSPAEVKPSQHPETSTRHAP